jgi:glycosyltransferase involved in cell wall biosynthesis
MSIVSIITPYRNSSRFIREFVLMLQRQSFGDWCCLMVDDQSSDDSALIASQAVGSDARFVLLSFDGIRASPGPAAVRNYALARVFTPLVAFCDVDDLWHPSKLELQLRFHSDRQLDLSVTGYWRFRDTSALPIFGHRCPPQSLSYRNLLGGNPIPMLTVIVRSDWVANGMPEHRHEDFGLWLNVFKAHPGIRYGCLPDALAFYRLHSGSITSRRWKMPFWALSVFRRHGLGPFRLLLAMILWLFDQVYRISTAAFSVRDVACLSVNELMERPPVRLVPGEPF